MRYLENRIPPPLVLLACIAMMVLMPTSTSGLHQPSLLQLTCVVALVLAGICIAVVGIISFRTAQTTVNPLKPDAASQLVTTGVFRYTRNPMYLGMLLVAIAAAIYTNTFFSMIWLLVFVLFITRFQIVPEERAMRELFGEDFVQYQYKVRRWL